MKLFDCFLQGGYKAKGGTEPVPFDVSIPLSWGTSNTNRDKVKTGEWTHTLQIENLPLIKTSA